MAHGHAFELPVAGSIDDQDPHRRDHTAEESGRDERGPPVDAEQDQRGGSQHERDRRAEPETPGEQASSSHEPLLGARRS